MLSQFVGVYGTDSDEGADIVGLLMFARAEIRDLKADIAELKARR
jgi:hypothetical protein